MPHSQQKHTYESNTHKIRRNWKTKYNDNKKTTISITESLKPSSKSHIKTKANAAGDSVDKVDRSRNVSIFGIDEATDTTDGRAYTGWRDTVIQTLSTAAGPDVMLSLRCFLTRQSCVYRP